MATVRLKLLIDKEKNRVVFAESEKEFVDILFSFLTLPMGTIIRLLNKQSFVGCMDKLYESVENLDTKYLKTEACKTLLLQPRSAAEQLCEDLTINADDLNPRRLYMCPKFDCVAKKNPLFCSFSGLYCPCGKAMDKVRHWARTQKDEKTDAFLRGEATYIITDDLRVTSATASDTLSMLQKLGIKDAEILETRTVDVHRDEVLGLLNSLLVSRMPLTDVFLRKQESVEDDKKEYKLINYALIKSADSEMEVSNLANAIKVKLVQNTITSKVVYAEAGKDMVDVVLSFLTFPLGSIVKLLKKHSYIGCVDNLYSSVEVLCTDSSCIKSEECKHILLSPKLYPHYDFKHQILEIEANLSKAGTVRGCESCWDNGIISECKHNVNKVTINEINPKMSTSVSESGGGYVKDCVRFMISDNMIVKQLSPVSGIDLVRELKVPISSLQVKEVTVSEVLNLLRACLTSSRALSNVFAAKKRRKLV